jgi:hypothetical protein
MHSSIKFDFRCGFVVARVEPTEVRGRGQDQHYLDRIADHCLRCRCASILIEKYTPDTFEVWRCVPIAGLLAGIGHQTICIAVAERGAEPPDNRKLDVAVGAGHRLRIEVFPDVAAAEAWLLTKDNQQLSG